MSDDASGPSRRDLFLLGAGAAMLSCIGRDDTAGGGGELDEVTIAQLQARMKSGHTTAAALVSAYIARIEALNQQGPMLRAVLEVNPEAVAIAERLDAERARGAVRGPLHGIRCW